MDNLDAARRYPVIFIVHYNKYAIFYEWKKRICSGEVVAIKICCLSQMNRAGTSVINSALSNLAQKTPRRDIDIAKTRFRELERERKI